MHGCRTQDDHATKKTDLFLGSILFPLTSNCIQYPTKTFVSESIFNKNTNATTQFEYERVCSFRPQDINYQCYVNGLSEILYYFFSIDDFFSKFKQLTVLDGLRKKMNSQFEENYERDGFGRLSNYLRKDDSYGEMYFEWDSLKRVRSGKIIRGECSGTITNWVYNEQTFGIQNLTDSVDSRCKKNATYQYGTNFQIQRRILEENQMQTRSEYNFLETGTFCRQVD